MLCITACGVLFVLIAGLSAPAHAQRVKAPTDETIDAVSAQETVVVTATRAPAAIQGVPASTSVVTRKELEHRKPVRLGDAVVDVPGLYVRGAAMGNNFPGSGQAVLSLRGIPRTPRTLVMIDGAPVNNALSGGINVVGIPVHNLDRVEVVRGPYSALYGGNAMGGVVNFISAGPDQPLTEVRVGAGSMGQRGTSFIHRKRYEGGLGVSLSVGYRDSDGDPDAEDVLKTPTTPGAGVPVTGARPTRTLDGQPAYRVGTKGERPWRQRSGQLSLYYSPSSSTDLVAGLSWADYDVGYSRPESFLRDGAGNVVHSGLVLVDGQRLRLADTDWFTPTPSQERDWRNFMRMTHRLAGGSELRAQLSTLRHAFQYVQPTRNVAEYKTGPGELVDQPTRRIDLDVSLHTPMTESWTLVSGVSWNRSTMDRHTSALSRWRDPDTNEAILTRERGESSNIAAYFQSEHYLPHDVTAYVGGRYDRYESEGRVIDVAGAFDERYGTRRFEQFSPKLALVWEAQPWLSLRTSYGEAFRPPALLDLFGRIAVPLPFGVTIYEPGPDLDPERVRALEIGADVAFAGGKRASVTLYKQQLKDLIYRRTVSPTLVRPENAGEADVNGIEASLRWPTPLRNLSAVAAYTHQFKYEITRNDAAPASVGKVLTDMPRTTWSTGVEYERGAWSGLLMVRHVGHAYGSADDMNENKVEGVYGSFDEHTVVAARVGWRIDRNLALSVSIDNLTNRDYYVYNRQPGRTFYTELSYRF